MRGLVMEGPDKIEPYGDGPRDIEISPWGNVRDMVTVQSAQPALAQFADLQAATHEADRAAVAERRAAHQPRERLTKEHEAIVIGSAKMLVVGLYGEDPAGLVDQAATMIGLDLTEANEPS